MSASVLVAEDDAPVRETVRRGLELAGCRVDTAADGAEALDLLRGGLAPDLVLADIRMPVMDGIALALAVAREWPRLPVLLMTAYADQRERADGLDDLIAGVVRKPFSLAELRAAVEAALGRQSRRSSRSI